MAAGILPKAMHTLDVQPAQPDVEKMQAELAWMKDAARLRRRHGQQLTDDQINELLAEEATRAANIIKAKEAAELNRQNEIAMDKKYRALACELVRKGTILISLEGSRVTTLSQDLLLPCPLCGQPLTGLSDRVYALAKAWYWSSEDNRVDTFIVHSARNPLSEKGFPGHALPSCPHCRQRLRRTAIQLVVV